MPEPHPALAVVHRYIERSGALDADGLEPCFGPGAALHGFLGPNPVAGEIAIYLADVRRMAAAGTDMSAYRASVAAFDGQTGVASATVHMEGFAGARFVDFLHLMVRDGTWLVVSKTFTTR